MNNNQDSKNGGGRYHSQVNWRKQGEREERWEGDIIEVFSPLMTRCHASRQRVDNEQGRKSHLLHHLSRRHNHHLLHLSISSFFHCQISGLLSVCVSNSTICGRKISSHSTNMSVSLAPHKPDIFYWHASLAWLSREKETETQILHLSFLSTKERVRRKRVICRELRENENDEVKESRG